MPLPGKLVLPVFLLMLVLGAMILGPLLYFIMGLVWPIPFHRAMDRALLISAVGTLILFRARMPLRQLWPGERGEWKELLLGYFIAVVSIQAMVGFNLALAGFTSSYLSESQAVGRVLLALAAALIAPPLEETVFRGFVQRELVRGLGWKAGWILAAIIFTLAHFLKIPVEFDHQPVHWWSGPVAVSAAFLPIVRGEFISGQGLNLFLIGLILGGIFLRSGSLWMSAGLHSGWIFALLIFTGFTRPIEPPFIAYMEGNILSNLSTTLVLLLLSFWLWRYYRNPSIVPETGSSVG